jgi:transcriptional regulator with XRE-family HTH domain
MRFAERVGNVASGISTCLRIYRGGMSVGMTLEAYLKQHGITHKQFAELLGCEQPTVTRFVAGRIPSPDLMRLISEKTAGAVTPNDFFGIAA